MTNNNCFEKVNIKLSDTNRLYTEFSTFDYKHTEVPQKIYEPARTFKRSEVPIDYFENEPIKELMLKYNLVAKIFLVEAEHFYNWHRDTFRYNAFNMLLQGDDDYLTLFSHKTPASSPRQDILNLKDFVYKPMTRLIYEPGYFYLLNSQIPHMIVNYGKKNRYLLTLANYENKALDTFYGEMADYTKYHAVVQELKQSNLI